MKSNEIRLPNRGWHRLSRMISRSVDCWWYFTPTNTTNSGWDMKRSFNHVWGWGLWSQTRGVISPTTSQQIIWWWLIPVKCWETYLGELNWFHFNSYNVLIQFHLVCSCIHVTCGFEGLQLQVPPAHSQSAALPHNCFKLAVWIEPSETDGQEVCLAMGRLYLLRWMVSL